MHARLQSLIIIGILAIVALCPAKASDPSQQIWLAAPPRANMMQLYNKPAQWQRAARSVNVIKLYAGQILTMPAGELRQVFSFMKDHGMRLAVEYGPLHQAAGCGPLEGFNPVPSITRMANRVQRLGGRLDYAAMDEPYWFAHIYSGPRSCHWSAAQIAKNAMASYDALRKVFPAIAIGDIEPVSQIADGNLLDQYATWINVWREKTRSKLAFFDADVNWSPVNDATLAQLAKMLAVDHIVFGVIYDGRAGDLSNSSWIDSATRHFVEYENGDNPLPDQVIFQDWNDYPVKLLPEGHADAYTHLILRYLRKRTMFADVKASSLDISGRLLAQTGAPIEGARVELSSAASLGRNTLSLHGTTPWNAKKMLFAWRINTECGGCDGAAHLMIGHGTFQQAGIPAIPIPLAKADFTSRHASPRFREADGGDVELTVASADRVSTNSHAFDVNPAADFTVQLPYNVIGSTSKSVVFDIIFLGADGKEVARSGADLLPMMRVSAQATTNRRGEFEFAAGGRGVDGALRLTYAGNASFRPASRQVDANRLR